MINFSKHFRSIAFVALSCVTLLSSCSKDGDENIIPPYSVEVTNPTKQLEEKYKSDPLYSSITINGVTNIASGDQFLCISGYKGNKLWLALYKEDGLNNEYCLQKEWTSKNDVSKVYSYGNTNFEIVRVNIRDIYIKGQDFVFVVYLIDKENVYDFLAGSVKYKTFAFFSSEEEKVIEIHESSVKLEKGFEDDVILDFGGYNLYCDIKGNVLYKMNSFRSIHIYDFEFISRTEGIRFNEKVIERSRLDVIPLNSMDYKWSIYLDQFMEGITLPYGIYAQIELKEKKNDQWCFSLFYIIDGVKHDIKSFWINVDTGRLVDAK